MYTFKSLKTSELGKLDIKKIIKLKYLLGIWRTHSV